MIPARLNARVLRWLALAGAAAAFLLATGILAALGLPDPVTLLSERVAGTPVGPVIGALAPDFVAVTSAGETVTLRDLRGRVVIINFWATWCGPCTVEMPVLQSLADTYALDQLRILAVNVDEPAARFVSWAAARGLTFDLLPDLDGAIQRAYHLRGTPQTVVIGPDGAIRAIFYGAVPFGQLDRTLARYLPD